MNNNSFTKIFIFIWLFSFLFILITLISLGAFKEDIDVKNIKDKILEYIDEKDTEIYLENQSPFIWGFSCKWCFCLFVLLLSLR